MIQITEEKIHKLAEKYARNQKINYPSDYFGFINGFKKALDISRVVGQSEQLVCDSWYSRDNTKHGLCENCGKSYKNHKAN